METLTESEAEIETENENELVFPLNNCQNIFIPTEATDFVISCKIEAMDTFKLEKNISGTITKETYNNIITQTNFILKKKISEAMEFTAKVTKNRYSHSQQVKKDTYKRYTGLQNYIDRNAVNFIVMGYPCEKTIEIGRIIAHKLNYLHIYPNKLINKEIYKRTPVGLWIYKYIKHDKKIPIDILEVLLKKEMSRKVYSDHGCVISGYPVLPNFEINDSFMPQECFGEEYLQIDIDFPNKIKNEIDFVETDDDVISLDDSMADKESKFDQQNEEIMSECSESELESNEMFETDEDYFYFSGIEDCDDDEYSENEIDMDKNIIKYVNSVYFKTPKNINDSIIQSYESQLKIIKSLHIVPSIIVYVGNDENLDTNIEVEQDIENIGLRNFQTVLPSIDYFIACYSSENVWMLDGRLRLDLISEYIDKRLLYIQRKQFYMPEVIFPNQHIPEYFKKYLSNDPECDFEVLRKTNCIEPKYKWFCYSKNHYCPVKAYEGKLTQGRSEYAVRFLGRIFMCSTKNSLKKFIKHPEKYLFFKPNCRIAICAPQKFGTSILAQTFKGCYKSAGIYETKNVVLQIAMNKDDAFSEATRLAMDESNEILKLRYDYFSQMKLDKIDELTDIPLTVLMDIINDFYKKINNDNDLFRAIDCFKKILLDEEFLHQIFPSACFESLLDSNFDSALTQLLFEENVYEICMQELVQNKHLAQNFINWRLIQKKENKKLNVNRYDQWILDGPPIDINFWKSLERRKALPDYVIIPKCITLEKLELVYISCKQKFRHYKKYINELLSLYPNTFFFNIQNFEFTNFRHKINKEDEAEIKKHAKFIAQFRMEKINNYIEKLKLLKKFLINKKISIIEADYSDNIELNVNIFKILREYFIHVKPKMLTVKMVKNYFKRTYVLNNSIEYNKNEEIDESVESNEEYLDAEQDEEEEELDSCNEESDIDLSNFFLGPTDKYCPVCVKDSLILRKGLIKYCCEYRNHIILLSSEICLKKFNDSPEKYFYSSEPPIIPPPKFCIVGVNYVNTLLLAKLLKEKFNIALKTTKIYPSTLEFDIFFEDKKVLDDTEENFDYLKLKNIGLVVSGFPNQESHIDIMIENGFYPEAAFVLEDKEQIYDSLMDQLKKMSIDYRPKEKSKSFLKSRSELFIRNIIENEEKLVKKLEKLNITIIRVKKNILNDSNLFDTICHRINNNRIRHAMFTSLKLISTDTAESLIAQGYCTMSRFQRACPVEVADINCICNYEGMLQQNKIFPCIHRLRIYFISGKESLKKFLSNPQHYIETCNPFPLSKPIITLVKGASKSGVTSLCRRISKEYGMHIFTEEDIKKFINTELSETRMCNELERNKGVLNPYLLRVLNILKNSAATGIILDNFSITPDLLVEILKYGININPVYFIETDFLQICKTYTSLYPMNDISEIAQSYEDYKKIINEYDNNNNVQFFNIIKICTTKNRWQVWDTCKHILMKTFRNMITYKFLLPKTGRSSLKHLNVFYEELFSKLDDPPLYCYACLKQTNKQVAYRYDWCNVGERFYTRECQWELTKPNGYRKKWLYDVYRFPKPYEFNEKVKPLLTNNNFKKNFMQIYNKIYWICDCHYYEIIMFGTAGCYPLNEKYIPTYYPILIQNYPITMVVYNGYCIVSYDLAQKGNDLSKDNFILQFLTNLTNNSFFSIDDLITNYYFQGNRDLAIYYRGNIYLCANEASCLKFLQEPEYYRNLKFLPPNDENIDSESEVFDFKNLSSDILIKGLKALSAVRPKHFGLTYEESAAVYLGLFFKSCVPGNKDKKNFYKMLINEFVKECNAVTKKIQEFKMDPNPFLQLTNYFEPVDKNKTNTMDNLLAKFKCTCVGRKEKESCE